MILRNAPLLSLQTLSIALLVGCGGNSDPAPVAPNDSPTSIESNDDLSPPDISMPETSTIEGGPGTGSEFDVPPDLGNPTAETTSTESTEPEFKLPPSGE